MLYKEIDTVEFDLNTVCNSYCPPCHRYTVQDGELFHNPYVKLGVNLELDVIERVFENSRITDDCFVDLVGLVGEPIAHPKSRHYKFTNDPIIKQAFNKHRR